jgi:hypothetical protein
MNFGIERAFDSKDVFTVIFVCILILILFVKLTFPRMFPALLKSLFSKVYFLDYFNEFKKSFHGFKWLLLVMQNVVFTLFFYQVYILSGNPLTVSIGYFLFYIFIGITLFLAIQYMLSLSVACVFDFVDVFKSVQMIKFAYLNLIAFAVLPLLLVVDYGNIRDAECLKSFLILYFEILCLISFVFLLVKNNKVIVKNLFYFILYLCTLEIAPLLFIYKLGVNKF